MADAAVSHVIQSLDYLLRFMHVILRIKKSQIRTLSIKACQYVRLAEDFSNSNNHKDRALLLKKMMWNLYIDTQNIEEASKIKITLLETVQFARATIETEQYARATNYNIHHSTPERIGNIPDKLQEVVDVFEVPEILEEISLFEAKLENISESIPEILEGTDLRELDRISLMLVEVLRSVFKLDSMHTIIPPWVKEKLENPTPVEKFTHEIHQDMLNFYPTMKAKLEFFFAASAKLKEETTFIYEEAMKIKGLCQDLRWLRLFLWDFANPCKNHELVEHLEKSIRGVLNSANTDDRKINDYLFPVY